MSIVKRAKLKERLDKMKINLGLLLAEVEEANKVNGSMVVSFNPIINPQTKKNGLLVVKKLRAFRSGLE